MGAFDATRDSGAPSYFGRALLFTATTSPLPCAALQHGSPGSEEKTSKGPPGVWLALRGEYRPTIVAGAFENAQVVTRLFWSRKSGIQG
jgi:hypothetical protein